MLSDALFVTVACGNSLRPTPSLLFEHLAWECLSKVAHVASGYPGAVGILCSNGLGISPCSYAGSGQVYAVQVKGLVQVSVILYLHLKSG